MQRENTMENLANLIDELEIDGKFYYNFFFFKSDFNYFFFF
jgi:hypothetical protein